MHTLTRRIITTVTSLLAVGGLAFGVLFTPAQAAAPHQEGTPQPGQLADGSRFELACRQTRRLLEGQQDRLGFANDIADRTQTWIDQLKAEGKDTAGLESALAAYNTAIDTAQSQHDSAQSTFDTHAGFDDDCQLTDRDQARATLRTVADGLRSAHRTITDGSRAFRRAVQDWRRAQRAAAVTTP